MVTVAISTSFAADVFAAHDPQPDLVVADFAAWLDEIGLEWPCLCVGAGGNSAR
jgi:hypothetical protein